MNGKQKSIIKVGLILASMPIISGNPPTAAKVAFEKISEVIRFFNMRKEVILGSLFKKQMGS